MATSTEWIPVVLSIVSLIGTVVTLLFNTRKRRAEAAKVLADSEKILAEAHTLDASSLDQITNTALALIKPLKEQLEEFADDLEKAGQRIEVLQGENATLKQNLSVMEESNANASKRLAKMENDFELEQMRSLRLRGGVTLLINQIMFEGLHPVWTLDDLTKEEIDGFNDSEPDAA